MDVSLKAAAALGSLLIAVASPVQAETTTPETTTPEPTATETILFIRHAEKPPGGLGQLDCQGLNRALALPAVIRRKYKRLDAVFAPNPAQRKPDAKDANDQPLTYDYVRPLATAEPTAIAFGLPIQVEIGFSDTAALKAALLAPAYRDATVLVAWEHHHIVGLMPDLIAGLGGDAKAVPDWPKTDFDSIWRVTIERAGAATHVAFAHDQQGLDGQPKTCPQAP